MGDIAEYYRDNECVNIFNDEVFNDEHYNDIWTKYQKRKLFWTTKEGNRILISDMEDAHLVNTINHLEKKGEYNTAINEWIDALRAEIKNRNKC